MPIQEQDSSTILSGSNVTDNSSLLSPTSSNNQHPSIVNLFDETSPNYFSSLISTMNSSDKTKTSTNYNLNDTDLTTLLVSSLLPSSLSLKEITFDNNNDLSNNILDDVFLNQINDLVDLSSSMSDKPQQQQQPIGPPPGFENFLFNSSTSDLLHSQTTNNTNSTKPSINNVAIKSPPVSSSDTINFSQLLQSTTIADPQQQLIVGNVGNIRSSSSSHSSYTSDDQSIYYPISTTHPYSSSSAKSQIYSNNKPSLSTTTNCAAKPHIPNSLSLNNDNNFSSSSSISLATNSTTNSPITPATTTEHDKRIIDGYSSSNHMFSFLNNGHTDFSSSAKFPSNLRTSSSASSTSSVDDSLIHLTQQEQKMKKFFNNGSVSLFPYSKSNIVEEQEQAVHDNLSYLASMATGTIKTDDNSIQPSLFNYSQTSRSASSLNIQELIENLNEICYKGFDDLNAIIQEQRWIQNYFNMNSSLIPSSGKSNGCSSGVLTVSEYFIFKCKKFEISAYHVFDLLSNARVELRLRDLMFVFKSWKEAILNAEKIHQEEDNKLRLTIEQPQSYYMTDKILQATFDRVSYTLRQLCNLTQQVRAAYQYATLNVFQTASRQQQQQTQSHSLTSVPFAQLQSIPRINGSIRTTP